MKKLSMNESLEVDIVTAYMTVNGNKEELFYAKKLNAMVHKIRSKKNGKEKVSWVGKGIMSVYAITPLFRDLMRRDIERGKEVYFDIEVISRHSRDPIKEQKITLRKCKLESINITVFDAGNKFLEETVSFTYKDFLIV